MSVLFTDAKVGGDRPAALGQTGRQAGCRLSSRERVCARGAAEQREEVPRRRENERQDAQRKEALTAAAQSAAPNSSD